MIKLPKLVGEIRKVPIKAYKEIIDNYVAKVSVLPAVKSIIQMGSFTAPGLSDIDLIVVLKEDHDAPIWKDISLIQLSDHFEYKEVIAHDIFIINESIADNAEAYFYIDAQVVLHGTRLGGNIKESTKGILRNFLSIEYSVFTLESLFKILLNDELKLRNALLLLSTSRHTATTAANLDIITEKEKLEIVDQVEELRLQFLEGLRPIDDLNNQYFSFLELLFKVIDKDPIINNSSRSILKSRTRRVSNKTEFYWMSNPLKYVSNYIRCVSISKELFLKGRFSIVPIPEVFNTHLLGYGSMKSNESESNEKGLGNRQELNVVYDLRKQVILEHWNFIEKHSFIRSSGKAYCGFGYSPKQNFQRRIIFDILRLYTKFSILPVLNKSK